MEDSGSRYGLATFLASSPAMYCDMDVRRLTFGPFPRPLFHRDNTSMTEDNQRPAHSLTTVSNQFRRIGSNGDWQLRILPTGAALWMADAHHQWRLAAYALEVHQCGTLAHPAAHYHIQDPLLWRLAGRRLTHEGIVLSCE